MALEVTWSIFHHTFSILRAHIRWTLGPFAFFQTWVINFVAFLTLAFKASLTVDTNCSLPTHILLGFALIDVNTSTYFWIWCETLWTFTIKTTLKVDTPSILANVGIFEGKDGGAKESSGLKLCNCSDLTSTDFDLFSLLYVVNL